MAKVVPGVPIGTMYGSSGSVTFVRSRSGMVLRERSVPRDPKTPLQWEARDRMRRVGRAWTALTLEQAKAWKTYANDLANESGGPDAGPQPTGQALFVRLGLKVLQADPTAEVPTLPPAQQFLGDAPVLTVIAAPGAVRFESSAANSSGVVTELLLQPLRSIHRNAYPSKYRSQAFVAFSGAGLAHDVSVLPGPYSAAYRFVRLATGQETALAPLGLVVVP